MPYPELIVERVHKELEMRKKGGLPQVTAGFPGAYSYALDLIIMIEKDLAEYEAIARKYAPLIVKEKEIADRKGNHRTDQDDS